jgi:hypothetical protein
VNKAFDESGQLMAIFLKSIETAKVNASQLKKQG